MSERPEYENVWFHRLLLPYTAISIALLAYCIVAWRGWFGVAPLSNPRTSLSLATFLAAMGLTWVALLRSPRWANLFGSAAVIAFVMYVLAMMVG